MSELLSFNPHRLILARERRKMTAIQLAEAAGISRVQLSRIEGGKSESCVDTVDALARVLCYPRAFFYLTQMYSFSEESVSFRSL
ncbi:MAG: helix-turn-helix transcriptional regulator [Aestuariivita sp.]|nr:helix-turn-helix transcriptional regulator [Aestuariivita sp.]